MRGEASKWKFIETKKNITVLRKTDTLKFTQTLEEKAVTILRITCGIHEIKTSDTITYWKKTGAERDTESLRIVNALIDSLKKELNLKDKDHFTFSCSYSIEQITYSIIIHLECDPDNFFAYRDTLASLKILTPEECDQLESEIQERSDKSETSSQTPSLS